MCMVVSHSVTLSSSEKHVILVVREWRVLGIDTRSQTWVAGPPPDKEGELMWWPAAYVTSPAVPIELDDRAVGNLHFHVNKLRRTEPDPAHGWSEEIKWEDRMYFVCPTTFAKQYVLGDLG
jgi:hypothetical protein